MLDYREIEKTVLENRKKIIQMTYDAGAQGAHIGGSLSLCEILTVLYKCIMKYDKDSIHNEDRDRVILSKGHGAIALYAVLNSVGIISDEELKTYKQDDSIITAHPSHSPQKGMEFASGSLGQGLSIGAGVALGQIKKNSPSRVFVIVGDGECDEGSIWEAAAFSAFNKLSNLVCIVDKNNLQYDGETQSVLNMDSLSDKWKSFGWEVKEINGHSIEELADTLGMEHNSPLVVICNTIKGNGVSFIENNYRWHNSKLTEEQYNIAMSEQV